MMGQTREQKIIKQVVGKPTIQKRTPIATDMFLPNHSGVSDKQIRRSNEVRHTKWFGSIQAAIDDLPATGGTVFVDAGTYTITTAIVLSEGVVIDGEGDNSLIKKSGNIDVFNAATGANNLTIKNICIDNEGQSGSSIDFVDNGEHLNIIINNVHIIDNDDRAIRIDGKNTTIQNCFFDNVFNGIGIATHLDTTDSYEVKIINNKIVNESYDDPAPATEYGEGIEINVHGNGSALITGNRINGFREEGIDCNVRYATITGNHISMVSAEVRDTRGITVSTEAAVHSKTSVIGNIIDDIPSTAGIGIKCSASSNNLTIIGNNMIGNAGSSIGIDTDATADNVTIIGNSFNNLGTEISSGGAADIILGNSGHTSDNILNHDLTTTGTIQSEDMYTEGTITPHFKATRTGGSGSVQFELIDGASNSHYFLGNAGISEFRAPAAGYMAVSSGTTKITRTSATGLGIHMTPSYALDVTGEARVSSNIRGGYFMPTSAADASAPNNSIYYSTTASKLVYKDSGGTVHNLY